MTPKEHSVGPFLRGKAGDETAPSFLGKKGKQEGHAHHEERRRLEAARDREESPERG